MAIQFQTMAHGPCQSVEIDVCGINKFLSKSYLNSAQTFLGFSNLSSYSVADIVKE